MIARLFKSDINKFHLMNSLNGLAWALIGVFIPVYFLILGYSLQSIFVYNISINILAIIDGWQAGFYWLSFHVLFSKFADTKNLAESTGKLMAIPQLVTMFIPLLGGFIMFYFSFASLVFTAVFIFILSFIPIFFTKPFFDRSGINSSYGISLYKRYKRFFYAEFFNNIGEEILGVIWPIFVYISLININSVGLVATLLAVSSAFFTFWIGKISDKKNKIKMIKIGAIFISVSWILRFYLDSEMWIYILTILAGMAAVIFEVPYYTLFYQFSKKENSAPFFAFREVPVLFSRIIVFTLAILFVSNLQYLFLIAALSYVYFLFLKHN